MSRFLRDASPLFLRDAALLLRWARDSQKGIPQLLLSQRQKWPRVTQRQVKGVQAACSTSQVVCERGSNACRLGTLGHYTSCGIFDMLHTFCDVIELLSPKQLQLQGSADSTTLQLQAACRLWRPLVGQHSEISPPRSSSAFKSSDNTNTANPGWFPPHNSTTPQPPGRIAVVVTQNC